MNGRLYDPVLGRILSPDPALQMPGNTQNFNRYSYCLNNPLKYTDPSGYLSQSNFWNNFDYLWNLGTDGSYESRSSGGQIPLSRNLGSGGGGENGGFKSGREFWTEVFKLAYSDSRYGGSSSGEGPTHFYEDDGEVLLAGIYYNIYHDSWGVGRVVSSASVGIANYDRDQSNNALMASLDKGFYQPNTFNKWLANYFYTRNYILSPNLVIPIMKNPFKGALAIFSDAGFTILGSQVDGGGFFVLIGKDASQFYGYTEHAGGLGCDGGFGVEIGRIDFSGIHKDLISNYFYGERWKIYGGLGYLVVGLSGSYAESHGNDLYGNPYTLKALSGSFGIGMSIFDPFPFFGGYNKGTIE